MNDPDESDVIASSGEVAVQGLRTDTSLTLSPGAFRSLATADERVYLALEAIRGSQDATVLGVYLMRHARDASDPPAEFRAGSIGLYGLTRASAGPAPGAGLGLRFLLDVTGFFGDLGSMGASPGDAVVVSIRLPRALPTDAAIVIGRLVLFRAH